MVYSIMVCKGLEFFMNCPHMGLRGSAPLPSWIPKASCNYCMLKKNIRFCQLFHICHSSATPAWDDCCSFCYSSNTSTTWRWGGDNHSHPARTWPGSWHQHCWRERVNTIQRGRWGNYPRRLSMRVCLCGYALI